MPMRLQVRHEIACLFETPARHAIQALRLTPRVHAGLRVHGWRITTDPQGHLRAAVDGHGNVVHWHSLAQAPARIAIVASGVVETRGTAGMMRDAAESLPPGFYRRTTPRTLAVPAIRALAATADRALSALDRLHRLMGLVHDDGGNATAAGVLDRGVEAHVAAAHTFVAAARVLDFPARVVSGFLCTRDGGAGTAHAWAEAHHAELGWIGFDAVTGRCPGEHHVPTGVGLDYLDAAPVRRVRPEASGGGLTARVVMADVQQQ